MADKDSKVFIFWGYDQFPYCVGGVATLRDDGDYDVPSYQGVIRRKHVIAVYPVRMGGALKDTLLGLKEEFHREQDAVLRKYTAKARETLPELPTRKP